LSWATLVKTCQFIWSVHTRIRERRWESDRLGYLCDLIAPTN
jgi:hypothetical protein